MTENDDVAGPQARGRSPSLEHDFFQGVEGVPFEPVVEIDD
jgi:hypothetical protein